MGRRKSLLLRYKERIALRTSHLVGETKGHTIANRISLEPGPIGLPYPLQFPPRENSREWVLGQQAGRHGAQEPERGARDPAVRPSPPLSRFSPSREAAQSPLSAQWRFGTALTLDPAAQQAPH